MEIKRSGSQPANKGSADWFTGTVWLNLLCQANTPARAAGASVTFEPGARTAWNAHSQAASVNYNALPCAAIIPGATICKVSARREHIFIE